MVGKGTTIIANIAEKGRILIIKCHTSHKIETQRHWDGSKKQMNSQYFFRQSYNKTIPTVLDVSFKISVRSRDSKRMLRSLNITIYQSNLLFLIHN